MVCLLYFILLFNLECLLSVGSVADCMIFIAEKRQREGIFTNVRPFKPDGCVELCERLNTCFAVNYIRLNATCQLLNRTMPESKLVKATKYFYKSVRSTPKESIDNDPCYHKKYLWDEICTNNTTTNVAECYPLCNTPPAIQETINETVEVEVGQNYTYRCQNGLFEKGDQNPTVTCQHDGSWTSANSICAPSASCDMGYRNVTLKGFYFCIKYHRERTDFNQAMKICESEKAKLLVVTTQDEIAELNNFSRHFFNWTHSFIGVSDETNEGHWVSWDGAAVSPDWNPQQTDNWGDEDCAYISFNACGVSDITCNYNLPFLCHKKMCYQHRVRDQPVRATQLFI